MYPRPIEHYFAPTELAQALELLGRFGARARLLSGGQSLMTQLKAREIDTDCLIDLNRIPGLSTIEEQDGELVIGAMVRHAELLADPLIARRCPILADAADCIGDPQVRNRGTIGGSLAFADILTDLPVAVSALDARIVAVKDGGGNRSIGIGDFFLGPRRTALAADELLSEIRIAAPGPGSGGAYCKQAPMVNGFAIVCVAVQLQIDAGANCRQAAIVVGGLASMPRRASAAMRHLLGRTLSTQHIKEVAVVAAQEIEVVTDFRASADYRSNLIGHYVETLIHRAVNRAGHAP